MLSCLKLFLHQTSDFTLSHNHCSKLDEHRKNKKDVVDSRRNVPYNYLGERSPKYRIGSWIKINILKGYRTIFNGT